jgi:2-polyprenyl-3-methyl-5-hydroxy-6-metoxy-1,4-benzoquinol methylase
MLESLTSCPNCNSGNFKFYLQAKDNTVSGEAFSLSECLSCGLIFTNPRPDQASIGRYYQSDDYISHTNSNKGWFNRVYQIARNYSIKKKHALLQSLIVKKEPFLLDIGCGTGEFLAYCKSQGMNCTGIEPSEKARQLAINNYSLDVSDTSTLSTLHNDSFDLITMWHVLEHVPDVKSESENLFRLIKPGGYCIIAVPNPTSFDARHYKADWAAYDVPRHLFHFKPSTLKNIFETAGFKFKNSYPMKMDSFYVSLLSEKYKTGKKNSIGGMIRAFSNGLKSNTKANSFEDYSSVIYVFKKEIKNS